MDLHNNPNLGTDLLAVKVRQLEDKIKELTQTVGTVEGNIENLSNRVTTANLEAENAEIQNLSVTETLQTNAMVLGESLEVGSATIGEVSTTSVSSEEIDSAVSHIGEADGESLDLTGDIHSASIKLDNLVNDVPIATTQYVGYNNNGKLIPVDPTKGVAKWENTARSNSIKPVDDANVVVPSALNLPSLETETMTDTVVLCVDESGTVVKKDASETLQKKLTAGYNISINDETNTISCDITTMQMKGSVETVEDLPTTGNVKGDVWNITTTNQNYCWNGSSWFIIGSSVDLTNYYTKSETYSKTESNSNFAPKNETYTKTQTEAGFVNRTFGTCSTSADTQSKEVSIPAITTLNTGCEIKVLFSNGNTSGTCAGTSSNKITLENAPTLKLNTFGAYPIKIGGEYAGEGFINAGDVHTFVFDGSAWNDMTSDVIYQGSTEAGNYEKKRNGLITEWGYNTQNNGLKTVTFPIIMSDPEYRLMILRKDGVNASSGAPNYVYIQYNSKNNNSFNLYIAGSERQIGFDWDIKGY